MNGKGSRAVSLLFVVLMVSSVAVAPVQGTSLDAGPVIEESAGIVDTDLPDDIITRNGEPTWIVKTSDRAALKDWADDTSARSIVSMHERHVVISAPADVVATPALPTLTKEGVLAAVSGVEAVYSNTMFETAVVESLDSRESVDVAPYKVGGVAFSGEMEQSSLRDARQSINADSVAATGENVTVGVVDTGLNTANGSLYQSRVVAKHNFIQNSSNVTDGVGHGSWVASAIAADPDTTTSNEKYEGVAPDANLVIAKALNSDGGSASDIARAIRWTEAQGADVISLSLGSPLYSAPIANAIRDALQGNVTMVVVAAGNSRQTVRYLSSPSDVPSPGVVSVAATTSDNASTAQSAYFSQVAPDGGVRDMSGGVTSGEDLTIGAPGTKITARVADTDGNLKKSTLSGTSMSTPIVSGAVALYLDKHPSMTNETATVKYWLEESATPAPNIGTTEIGHGLLNVSGFVTESATEGSQESARDPAAQSRDVYNRLASGDGWLGRLLAGVAS